MSLPLPPPHPSGRSCCLARAIWGAREHREGGLSLSGRGVPPSPSQSQSQSPGRAACLPACLAGRGGVIRSRGDSHGNRTDPGSGSRLKLLGRPARSSRGAAAPPYLRSVPGSLSAPTPKFTATLPLLLSHTLTSWLKIPISNAWKWPWISLSSESRIPALTNTTGTD
ncbi:hypothetical protein chiPu_0021917 [Chiloscyllium punctatum]|uniref:Uncharacterized protein n=1 Tax=Chiloscyllium punctatum TaxID=137246 RepID=A0A401RF41_CHIPU|nr:hypothetical protein [Chiloscyllium punctatum]